MPGETQHVIMEGYMIGYNHPRLSNTGPSRPIRVGLSASRSPLT
ncbi:MAG: hypothetical protein R2857_04965 [Vampirovibrionales bacterium]